MPNANETEKANMENEAQRDEPAADKKKPDMVELAEMAAERMEKANKKAEELIARQEKLAARAVLGGKSTAGEPVLQPPTPEELKKREIREQAKRIASSYGIDLDEPIKTNKEDPTPKFSK